MTETFLSQEQIDEFVVAAHSDLPKVEALLAEAPQLLNENASWMETALGAAAHTGNAPIVSYLLAQGAPMDICTAAMLGDANAVAAFLDHQPALIGATGPHDLPLLFYPVVGDQMALLQLLIERGADVNAGTGHNTALHAAAGYGRPEMVRYLLDQGAEFMATDYEGRTPLDVAEDTGHQGIIDMLQAHMNSA